MAGDQDKATTTGEGPRKPVHERPQLCAFILTKVRRQAVPLRIAESDIKGAGSGLFVGEDVGEGQEIFRTTPQILCRDNDARDVCDWCYINAHGYVNLEGHFYKGEEDPRVVLKHCKQCNVAQYCSKSCQKKAWANHHKFECTGLRDHPKIPPLVLALRRILTWYEKGILSRTDLAAMTALETQFAARDAAEDQVVRTDDDNNPNSLELALELMDWTKSSLYLKHIRALLFMLTTNAFNIVTSEQDVSQGACFDMSISLINHSCDPNAHIFVEGRRARVRSLRSLRAGEEITVSYTDPRADVLQRRSELKNNFFIECNCVTCKTEMTARIGTLVNRQSRVAALQKAQEDMQRLTYRSLDICTKTYPQDIELVHKYEEAKGEIARRAYPAGDWPDDLFPMPEVMRALAKLYEGCGSASSLRYYLRGTLHRRTRSGPPWVEDFFKLILAMLRFAKHEDAHEMWKFEGFLTRYEMKTVARGYIAQLCLDAAKAYGRDSKFVAGLYHFAADMLQHPGHPCIRTREFQLDFNSSQEKLLDWVGVDTGQGVGLPSFGDIVRLVVDVGIDGG